MKPAFAADAARRRSERDPGTHADNERIRLAALLASCVANLSKATGKVLRMPALPANVRYRQ